MLLHSNPIEADWECNSIIGGSLHTMIMLDGLKRLVQGVLAIAGVVLLPVNQLVSNLGAFSIFDATADCSDNLRFRFVSHSPSPNQLWLNC